MEIHLPNEVIQMALDANQMQLAWQSWNSIDEKYLDVQRYQYHIGEIVAALIVKEYTKK
jgi:hypothetical protein